MIASCVQNVCRGLSFGITAGPSLLLYQSPVDCKVVRFHRPKPSAGMTVRRSLGRRQFPSSYLWVPVPIQHRHRRGLFLVQLDSMFRNR